MNNKYSLPKDGGLIEVSAPRDIIHRYEKIHTTVYENEYLGVQYVADTIVKAIRTYNEIHCSNEVYEESQPFVLGLTTGRTPLGLYRELVKRHEEGQISFRNVAVYSLDEFYPIRSTEQQSRNFRIHEDFLNHIDILPENIHIPDGTVPEARISEYCASYDHSVRKIDLMIIGVGEQGKGEPAVLQGAGDTVLPQQAGRPGVVGGAQGQAGATAGVERGQGVLKHGFVLRVAEDVVPDAFHGRAYQLGLGAEVVVDAAHRDPAGGRDRTDVDRCPAVLLDQLPAGFQDVRLGCCHWIHTLTLQHEQCSRCTVYSGGGLLSRGK